MRKLLLKILALIVCVALTACTEVGSNNSTESTGYESQVAMGRYVEGSAGLDALTEGAEEVHLWLDEQGKLEAFIHNKQFMNYRLSEAGIWEENILELCEVLNTQYPDITSVDYFMRGNDAETYYIQGFRGEKDNVGFIAELKGNKLREIHMEWPNDHPTIFGMAIGEQNDMIVCNLHDPCMEVYDSEGRFKKSIGDENMLPVVVGDKLIGIGTSKIEIYDLNTYVKEKTIEGMKCNITGGDKVFGDNKNSIFLANSTGLFRLNLDGNIFEKVIEGKLSLLSSYIPIEGMIYQDEIYLGYINFDKSYNEQIIIKSYTYDEKVPTVPDQQITICSVVDRIPCIEEAATMYRAAHPDIYINFVSLYSMEDYYKQGGNIRSEDLEALSTQLLAGEGPDILVLDGLPIESYRQKGIFSDLTDCIGEVEEKEKLLDNVVTSYRDESGIYAVPLRFNLVRGVGEKQFIEEGFNLEKIAAYQEAHTNEQVMFPLSGKARIKIMTDWYQNTLFTKEGRVNTEEMTKYLQMIKSVSTNINESDFISVIGIGNGSNCSRVGQLLNHTMKADIQIVGRMDDAQAIAYILDKMPDCFVTAQVEGEQNIGIGTRVVAINKNSKNQEAAKEIIKLALKDEVQGNMGDGIPVNLHSLSEQCLYRNHMTRGTVHKANRYPYYAVYFGRVRTIFSRS